MEPYESQLVILSINYPIDVLQPTNALPQLMKDVRWQFFDHLRQGGIQEDDLYPNLSLHPNRVRYYRAVGLSTTLAIGNSIEDILRNEKQIVTVLQSGDTAAAIALHAYINNRHPFGGRVTKTLPPDKLVSVILDFGEGTYQQTLDHLVAQFGCRKKALLDKAKYKF